MAAAPSPTASLSGDDPPQLVRQVSSGIDAATETTERWFEDAVVISIEGTLGSGKTTLCGMVQEALGASVEVLVEPVNAWKDLEGGNLLQLFYDDPERWAYTFQSYAFMTRLMLQHKRPFTAATRILERSTLADKNIFARNAHISGLMKDVEWSTYQAVFDFYTTHTAGIGGVSGRPDGILYLATQPETCFARMAKRNRAEESEVPLDYVREIHTRHEEWLVDGTNVSTDGVPFVRLDGDREFVTDAAARDEMLDTALNFIETIRESLTRNGRLIRTPVPDAVAGSAPAALPVTAEAAVDDIATDASRIMHA